MAAPFGFSVGDFLAVMELIWTVTQALQESAGAVHDVQTILETLMSFKRAIMTCETLALEWMRLSNGNGDASLPERSLVNGINYQLKFCRERLLKLSTKLEPYTKALMKQKGNRTARDHLYKVKWIFSREEADGLQKDLSIHVQGLERYIAELGLHILQRTMKQSQSSLASIAQSQSSMSNVVASIDRRVTQIHHNLTSLHMALPQILGYAWEGGFSAHDKPIILMDALGRTVPIPFLFCTSPNGFHDLVELMFRDLPGHERVKRKSYNLIKQNSTEFIDASGWSAAVSPGSVVVMSIEVTLAVTDWEIRSGTAKISCPHCQAELNGSSARCSRCYRDCTILKRDRFVELVPQPIRPSPQSKSNTISKSKETGHTQSRTPAQRAKKGIELAHFQRVHIVRERMRPAWDFKTRRHQSALHVAIESGSWPEVQRLLDNEVELETRDDVTFFGWTPLQRAAHQGDYNLVDCIIGAGAEVNAPPADYCGKTALQAAADSGHLEIVERLLEAGADVNAPPGYILGRTALQAAADSGHLEIVARLLEAGAEVNAPPAQYHGRTSLQAAADSGHLEIVARLLEAGAEVNAPAGPDEGRTALQAATGSGHLEIVARLLEAGADVNAPPAHRKGRTALQAAAGSRSGHLEIMERLLAAGADVNAPPAYRGGRTALQAAAGSGHLEIIERLLEAGAEVNAPAATEFGRTVLQAAAGSGHLIIVKRLLEVGADVNAPAGKFDGRTALQASTDSRHFAIVNILRQAGAAY